QLVPSGEVISLDKLGATAANNPSSDDHVTLFQVWALDAFAEAHAMPSGEVMTRFVPSLETATKILTSGAQAIEVHELFAALVRVIHPLPSTEVMTLVPLPVFETATNKRSSGDHVTLAHWFV